MNNIAYNFLSDSRFSKQPYHGLWCTKITKLNRSHFWKSSVLVENDLLHVCSSFPISVFDLSWVYCKTSVKTIIGNFRYKRLVTNEWRQAISVWRWQNVAALRGMAKEVAVWVFMGHKLSVVWEFIINYRKKNTRISNDSLPVPTCFKAYTERIALFN
jgi:hypothetical protein